ncbi:putative matrilysin [Helianthus anomalus]
MASSAQVLNATPLHCVILLIIVPVFSLSSNALPTSDWNTLYNLSGSHSDQQVVGISKLKSYLNQFGYITNNNSNNKFNDYFDDALEHAIKIYQKSFNLNTTGILDSSTINQMVKPRCGVPDIVNGTALMYEHPYIAIYPEIPEAGNFTYAFDPKNKLSNDIKQVFTNAFKQWSKWSQLMFIEDSSYFGADIKIGFYASDHGDSEPFEECSGSGTAIDLETVVVHEIGHVLGLGHSSVEDVVMFPTMPSGVRKVKLNDDDIDCAANFYAMKPMEQTFINAGYRYSFGLAQMLLFMTLGLFLLDV